MVFVTEQAMQLLDFSKKLDINLLDRVIECFYNGSGEEVCKAKLVGNNYILLSFFAGISKIHNYEKPWTGHHVLKITQMLLIPQQKVAGQILSQFKESQEVWTQVDSILELSSSLNTKYFALQVLEILIKTRWKALPREQCEGGMCWFLDSSRCAN